MNQHKQRWSFQNASLERSFLWSLAITALPVASGFAVSWVTARFGGPRIIGTVSWVMSFATALLIPAKFGLDLAASRLASEYGVQEHGLLRRLFRTAFAMRVLCTLVVAVPTLLFARDIATFFNDVTLVAPIRVGALIIFCASLYEFDENFLVGLNRLPVVSVVRSVQLLIRVAVTTALVLLGFGATYILGGYAAAWLVGITLYTVMLVRYLPPAGEGSERPLVRDLLLLSLPLAISSASVTIYSHMDRLMIGYFTGVDEVGQYAVARNITEVSLFPVFAMVMMLRPALASRFASGRVSECGSIIGQSLRFGLVSGTLFAALFAALGAPLVTMVFSNAFAYSGSLMIFFVGIVLMRSLGAVILPALVAANRNRFYAYLTTLSAVVNFALNVVLIPRYEARGAIISTIVSYGLLLVFGLREVFITYGVRVTRSTVSLVARTILAGIVVGFAFWQVFGRSTTGWEVFIWAALLSIVYVALIIAFRVASIADLRGALANLKRTND